MDGDRHPEHPPWASKHLLMCPRKDTEYRGGGFGLSSVCYTNTSSYKLCDLRQLT